MLHCLDLVGRMLMAHILVLDDVCEAGVLIQKILGKKGHRVVSFCDEDAALAYAGSNTLDLAILDINLRRMDGILVLKELKKTAPGMRAIMLTGYPTIQTAQAARSLGADAYCVKPIDKNELEATVDRVLGSNPAEKRKDKEAAGR